MHIKAAQHVAEWLQVTDRGLYCAPGDFYIDPHGPVHRAVITHGHADHARPGHGHVLCTSGTGAIMRTRYAGQAGRARQLLDYGEVLKMGAVSVRFVPAGHVLGSAQVVLDHAGSRATISGDYKRRADPTCAPFEVVPSDIFITEATFGLPVFRHPPIESQINRLMASMQTFPDRTHLVGVYALGKCQRLIMELRRAGYDAPIYLHGALKSLCDLYEGFGCTLGALRDATVSKKAEMRGALVMAPPSATRDRWSRRLADPVVAQASGWMQVRQRAKQRGVELPLIISDHADWDELTQTLLDVEAQEIWVTHGREEGLVRWCQTKGLSARALSLVGREDEEAA